MIYEYRTDNRRANIMSIGMSGRGSAMWHITDVEAGSAKWLEQFGVAPN